MPTVDNRMGREDRRELWGAGALLTALVLAGILLPGVRLLELNQHLFLAANVLALNFCLGLGGQTSMAHGAFCGMGAYGSVIAHSLFPGHTLVVLVVVLALTFAVAYVVAYPLETLGAGFLAMSTLGVSLIFTNFIIAGEGVTGGTDGLLASESLSLFGYTLAGDRAFCFAFIALIAVSLLVYVRLRDSRLGRALAACSSDPQAASSCGINRPATSSLAFGVGACVAACAGVLSAHYTGFINPGMFDLGLSLKVLLFLVIAAPGRVVRPLVVVIVLEVIFARLHALGDAKTLIHGLLLAGALVVSMHSDRLRPRLHQVQRMLGTLLPAGRG